MIWTVKLYYAGNRSVSVRMLNEYYADLFIAALPDMQRHGAYVGVERAIKEYKTND